MSKTTYNPTFQQFVDDAFQDIFNGLITGGTKEMKAKLHMNIQIAVQIMSNGGFAKTDK